MYILYYIILSGHKSTWSHEHMFFPVFGHLSSVISYQPVSHFVFKKNI